MSRQALNPLTEERIVSAAERWLRWLLRINGILCVLAIVAVLMPHSWLAWAVERVEPGTPARVLVSYLARVLSAFYVLLGILLLVFASDVRRYACPIRLLALGWLLAPILFLLHGRLAIAAGQAGWFFWMMAADAAYACAMATWILLLQARLRAEAPSGDPAPGER